MIEVQVDTIVGPTHYYGGLSYGNVASMTSRLHASNPKLAALQGLEKMKQVYELGVCQLILPPQQRPQVAMLKSLGFTGSEQDVIEAAYKKAPDLLIQCSSQSAMWTANAATVSPSCDTEDAKVHITCANLSSNLHRSLEAQPREEVFRQVFYNPRYFVHHTPLPCTQDLADEGAANHTRFSGSKKGVHFFVYGRNGIKTAHLYPARQTRLASEAIARQHGLDPKRVVFAQQNPKVIDLGVFHNDVIAVGHENLFFFHEDAYVNTQKVLSELLSKSHLNVVCVRRKDLSVEEAVKSYIFNSQFLTLQDGSTILICPTEVEKCHRAKTIVESRLPVDRVYYLPLHQSMKNGGGPACLRLRMPLTDEEIGSILPSVIFTPALYRKLKTIIIEEYPDSYKPQNLLLPAFRKACQKAVKKITTLLGINDT